MSNKGNNFLTSKYLRYLTASMLTKRKVIVTVNLVFVISFKDIKGYLFLLIVWMTFLGSFGRPLSCHFGGSLASVM